MSELRIGVSGWSYAGWRGPFYPALIGSPPARVRQPDLQLDRDQRVVLQASDAGQLPRLVRETPRGFRFAVKGSRFITHNKKLRDVHTPMANFLASGVLLLREKLGPFVWQVPERFAFQPDRIDAFLSGLPHDTTHAARLAAKHDRRVKRGSVTEPLGRRRLRHALEVRNEGWLVPDLVRILRRHRVALVVSDAADWPRAEEVTAGFVYIRLHGAQRTYASRYSDRSLNEWADRIRAWAAGAEPHDAAKITDLRPPRRQRRDVYVYFDNDQVAHARAMRCGSPNGSSGRDCL